MILGTIDTLLTGATFGLGMVLSGIPVITVVFAALVVATSVARGIVRIRLSRQIPQRDGRFERVEDGGLAITTVDERPVAISTRGIHDGGNGRIAVELETPVGVARRETATIQKQRAFESFGETGSGGLVVTGTAAFDGEVRVRTTDRELAGAITAREVKADLVDLQAGAFGSDRLRSSSVTPPRGRSRRPSTRCVRRLRTYSNATPR